MFLYRPDRLSGSGIAVGLFPEVVDQIQQVDDIHHAVAVEVAAWIEAVIALALAEAVHHVQQVHDVGQPVAIDVSDRPAPFIRPISTIGGVPAPVSATCGSSRNRTPPARSSGKGSAYVAVAIQVRRIRWHIGVVACVDAGRPGQ